MEKQEKNTENKYKLIIYNTVNNLAYEFGIL